MEVHDLSIPLRKRVRTNRDCVIAITGTEGEGKSTLAYLLGKDVDKDFDLEKNEIFSPTKEEMNEKITKLPKYSAIIADEAIKIMYKLRWGAKISIYINMLYSLCRKENKISILCMPRFKDFNEYFRNHRTYLWIHVIERGTAVIFGKSWSPASDDPWNLVEMDKRIKKLTRFKKLYNMTNKEKIKILMKTENFLGVLNWENWPDETEKKYNDLRDKNKYADMEDQELDGVGQDTRADRYQKETIILSNKLKEKLNWTDKEISELLQTTQDTIKSRRLRVSRGGT